MIPGDARSLAHRELDARLRPFVARRVSPGDVDDVLQDVYLRVQRGLAALRDDQRFGPWVYQVARSAIAEQRRARARHPLADGEALESACDEVSEEPTAEERLAAAVIPFIAMLPSPHREALTLTEIEGLTQAQAAERTGISLSGMKSRVQRGRAQLRELFEACCEIGLDARGRVIACEPKREKAPGGCRCSTP